MPPLDFASSLLSIDLLGQIMAENMGDVGRCSNNSQVQERDDWMLPLTIYIEKNTTRSAIIQSTGADIIHSSRFDWVNISIYLYMGVSYWEHLFIHNYAYSAKPSSYCTSILAQLSQYLEAATTKNHHGINSTTFLCSERYKYKYSRTHTIGIPGFLHSHDTAG